MSGDKLLGGPQAGLILGSRSRLDAIRKNPLTRSYRVDKLTLAALEATLALYRDPARALREIPALAQLTCAVDVLRERAERIAARVSATRRRDRRSSRATRASAAARFQRRAFRRSRCRSAVAPMRSSNGCAAAIRRSSRASPTAECSIDLRTIFPSEDAQVVAALRAALS